MRRILLLSLVILAGCAQHIADIKNEEHIGKQVAVSGTAENTMKIGSISGFTLRDGNSSILVKTEILPEEGKTVTVSGVVIKDSLFGYYIKADKIR
jgi:hypothetical protein